MIENNYVCGSGYPATDSGGLFAIDVSATNDPKVKNNTICGAGGPSMAVSMASILAPQTAGKTKASPVQ